MNQAFIRLENGVSADYMTSDIVAGSRPQSRILRTQEAIRSHWGDEIKLVSLVSGVGRVSTGKVTLTGLGSTQY